MVKHKDTLTNGSPMSHLHNDKEYLVSLDVHISSILGKTIPNAVVGEKHRTKIKHGIPS